MGFVIGSLKLGFFCHHSCLSLLRFLSSFLNNRRNAFKKCVARLSVVVFFYYLDQLCVLRTL